MGVDINADIYASKRLNIFFPGVKPELDGQCVSLVKWFMGEMANVPDWNAARGDARYVGDTLVRQGHAVEVPFEERKRGDILVYKFGVYGHIATLLSGDRVFEENVKVAGIASKIVDGERVYASRIAPLNESWRPVRPNVYRLKSYNEGEEMPIPDLDNYYSRYNKAMRYIRGRFMGRGEFQKNFVGNSDLRMLEAMLDSPEADAQLDYANWGRAAKDGKWLEKIKALENERDTLNYPKINAATVGLGLPVDANPEKISAAIADLKAKASAGGNEEALKMIINDKQKEIEQLTTNITTLAGENINLKAQAATATGDTELLNSFGAWLTKLIARLGVKK